MARTRFSIGAAIFVGLAFGGPFAGFGTFALCEGYRKLESGSYKMGELIGLFGAGGLFCLIGYGTIIALFRSHQYDKKIQKLEERYPHEPWRHRLDWAAGQISCSSRSAMIGCWFLALVWCGISAPGLYAIPSELEKGNKLILFVLFFAVVGVGLVYFAIVQTLRWHRFGSTVLKLSQATGEIGGRFDARLVGKNDLPPGTVFEVALKNVNRKTIGSGKHQKVDTTVLHELRATQSVSHGNLRTGIPIGFDVPAEGQSTNLDNPRDQTLWELSVKAEIPGADFEGTYMVPVFKLQS